MKKLYSPFLLKTAFVVLLMLTSVKGWGQQVIGSFPAMEGNFENVTIDNTVQTSAQANKWTKNNATTTLAENTTSTYVRSGAKSLSITNSSTTGRRVWSPLISSAFTSNVTVQYYRLVTNTTNTQESQSLIGNGTTGSENNTGSYSNPTNANVWEKVTYTRASNAYTNISGGLLTRSKNTGGNMYLDDFVMYLGAVDTTAPNTPGTTTVINNATNPGTSLDVSWGAASGGEDGGGYVVVRYAVNPNLDNDPNQNGIYAVGNTITNGTGSLTGTVRYIGTSTSFIDTGLAEGTTYYYKVYTVDKAFNYSDEILQSGTTTSSGHTVTFNSNFGTPTTTTQTSATSANLTSNSFTRTGYTFSNWHTTGSGTGGTTYTNGQTYDFSADLTLYAQWNINQYNVSYNLNGGTGTIPSTQTGNYNSGLTLATGAGFSRAGYTFNGWNTAANGSGTAYASGSAYTIPALNQTLYAQWTLNYNLTYDGNGNDTGTAPAMQTGATTYTVEGNPGNLTRIGGFYFMGWTLNADGSGTPYGPGDPSFTPTIGPLTANTTLYARYVYTIVYLGNGSDGGTAPAQQTNYNSLPTVVSGAGTLVRAGYTFTGWNTAADGSGTAYAPGANFVPAVHSGITQLHAQWLLNVPVISTSGTLTARTTTYGAPSANATFTVSANYLTNPLLITAPAGFEVSLAAGTGFATSLDLGTGTRTNTTIYVRLATTTPVGTAHNGNVAVTSTGATSVNVSIPNSTVTAKGLTITGLTGNSKVYDGTVTASVTGTPAYNGLVNSETFAVTGSPTWAFSTKNVGATLVMSGNYNAPTTNYTVTQPSLTAGITAKAISISGAIAQNKTFDGNNTATLTGTLSGVISPDVITLTLSGTFNNATVGAGKPVTSTSTISSTTNYILTQPTGLTADITAAVPTAPTITAITPTSGQLSVAFTAPASNGGATITNYAYSINGGTGFTLVSPTQTTSPIVITGLVNGTTYPVVIRAINSAGNGANSNTVNGIPNVVTSSTDYFRSNVTTGNWAAPGSWQSSADNTTWITSTLVPTSAANTITIRTGNTITVGATANGRNITVDAGGTLSVGAGFTISGTNTVNGTWNQNSTTAVSNSGTLAFAANSTYNHNANGGTIPTSIWDLNSTANIIGFTNSGSVTGPSGIAQSFGNLTINNVGTNNYINLFTGTGTINVNNTLTVGPASNNLVSFSNTSGTITANINRLNIIGGSLNGVGAAATVNITVANDLTISGTGSFTHATGNNGVANVTANNVILNDEGLLQLIGGTGSTVTSQTLNVTNDFIINGVSAQLNMKPNTSSSATATVNVGRHFSSNNTDSDVADVDFGFGTVLNNAINITGNLAHTGNGVYQTSSNNSARGFVFKGGSAVNPSTISYSGEISDYTNYVIDANAHVKLLTDLTLGSSENTLSPVSLFTVSNSGIIDFDTYSIIGHSRPRFNTAAGATLITANTYGIGGTSATGSLRSFASTGDTSANGRAQLNTGISYIFNTNTTAPFPTTNFGNPANLTINNANVTSNRTSNLIVSGNVNVNGTSIFALNSTNNNNLNLGGVLTIDPNATFDNNGENQITNEGGSIVINGTFITRDVQGFTGLNTAIPGITPTLGANSIIVYGLNGDQMVTPFAYRNITFAGSGVKTSSINNSIIGTVTINSGVTLDAQSNTFGTGSSTNLTMQSNSLFKTGGNGAKPDAGGDYVLDENSTIEFQGTSATTIKVTPEYENVNISGTNVEVGGKTFVVNQILKVINPEIVTESSLLTIPDVADNVAPYVVNAKKGIQVASRGKIIFKNNAQLMQNETASNLGSVQVDRNVNSLNNNIETGMDYVYWSSPVKGNGTTTGQSIRNGFSPETPATEFKQYRESDNRFVSTPDVTFKSGKGYAIRAENVTPSTPNPYSKTYIFTGEPNNGVFNGETLLKSATGNGYNLVGNPYPSNLDLEKLFTLNSAEIYSVAYMWTNVGYEKYQAGSGYKGNNYAIYNRAGGNPATTYTLGFDTTDKMIKVGQGFILQAKADAVPLKFNHTVRATDHGSWYEKNNEEKNRYWLQHISPENVVNTILVGYFDNATNDFDPDYDARLFGSPSDVIYSLLGTQKLLIQGKSIFNVEDKVSLGNSQSVAGNYTIKLAGKEGIFATGQPIYLHDKSNNTYTNLQDSDFVYPAQVGSSTNRFEIVYKSATLAAENNVKESLIIYRDSQRFIVKSGHHKIDKVDVYDAAGRLLKSINTGAVEVNVDASTLSSGVYFLNIYRNNQIINKKIIK